MGQQACDKLTQLERDTFLNGMLSCQGLLSQFTRKEVQVAFISGKFNVSPNTLPVLQSLDAMGRVEWLESSSRSCCPGILVSRLTGQARSWYSGSHLRSGECFFIC